MGLKDIVKKAAFVDIIRGMSVTGTYFLEEKVTVEYPKEKLQTYPRFRGIHALLTDPATGDAKCVACMLCPTICPSQCIHVEGEELPDGRSHAHRFDLDLGRCIFCGLCEEVCPVAAIVMTRFYEGSTFDKRDFLLTKEMLMANEVYAHKEVFVTPVDEPPAAPLVRGSVAGAATPPVAAGPVPSSEEAAAAADEPAPGPQAVGVDGRAVDRATLEAEAAEVAKDDRTSHARDEGH